MDGIQTLLIIVIISLTTLLIVVGFQVLMTIIDLRKALKRLNSMLDEPNKLASILELLKNKRL